MYQNKIPIKNWAEEDRPREKLYLNGKGSLSNAELLAILIASGYKNNSALSVAKEILSNSDNDLKQLGRNSIADLVKYKGIGVAKAINIVAAMEIGRRSLLSKSKNKARILSSEDAFNCVSGTMTDLDHEQFKTIYLNRNNAILKIETISIGGVSGTVVDPKVVYKKALENNSSSIILIHNHPSGNLKPSEADLQITDKLVKAGANLDIKVLDHLIIGDREYYSFADEGLI